jgi:hypothetical protein
MIRIDDYAWPLVIVTTGPDNLDAAAAQLHAFGRLCSADPRVIALVIPGAQEQALANLDRLLHWVRKFELQLMPHTIRLAWVVENAEVRATVSALLKVQDDHAFGCPTTTFASLDDAVMWLHAAGANPNAHSESRHSYL